jgi:mannose/cellobiose epimerase-like protein (N-acyl-D-glucosamine 2-epimerase family)
VLKSKVRNISSLSVNSINSVTKVRHWMFEVAIPTWVNICIDPVLGGPVETFLLDGKTPSNQSFRRTRVNARQIYTMCHASMLGVADALPIAEELFAYLLDRCWQGPHKGWAKTITPEGAILDPTPDFYDFAFCLFGLGWLYRATGNTDALKLAHQTLDILEQKFRHPSGKGFHNQLPPTLPRQQNPHMHLMEAALVLAQASGEARFRDLADEMAQLFYRSFFLNRISILPEFFTEELTPLIESGLNRLEPGHHFEWAWILSQHQLLTGQNHEVIVQALVKVAEKYGVDPNTQLTYNRLDHNLAPIDRGSRTWPNTERIKGWLGLYELTGISPWESVEKCCNALFSHHLSQKAPPGMWVDAFDHAARPKSSDIPASTFYHLFLAFSEVLRLSHGLPDRTEEKPESSISRQ